MKGLKTRYRGKVEMMFIWHYRIKICLELKSLWVFIPSSLIAVEETEAEGSKMAFADYKGCKYNKTQDSEV